MKIFNPEAHDKKDEIFFEKRPTDSEIHFKELWEIHFSFSGIGINQGAVCEDCEQYLKGDCDGGWIPELCIQTMADNVKILKVEKP